MEEKETHLKSLTEIVTGLSEKEESADFNAPNIFIAQNKEVDNSNKLSTVHKMNNLESEFYAPNTIEQVFSNDILLEQKIIKLRKNIESINYKIKAERTYENGDNIQLLLVKRNSLEKELNAILKEYSKIPVYIKFKNKFIYSVKFIGKLFKKYNFSLDLVTSNQSAWKKNLQKLNMINDEIDEILKTNTPYGENEDKYERLSASLTKALELRKNINK